MDWERGFSTSSPEFLLLKEEDMEEFRSEKTVKGGKSQEEIEKLMVDENLSEIERATLLISTGQDVQKVWAIGHLPHLLRHHQMDTLCKVVPKLCAILHAASVEVQEAASKAFTETVEQELVPVHIFTSAFLPTVLSQLESKDITISGLWLETLLSAVLRLPKDVVRREVLTIAVAKGQLSQTVSSRQASCQIIGKVAPKFEPFWLKRELLPLATTLCQDVDQEVRRCMCHQLNGLARALGLEMSKATILPELIELTNDEECSVRVSAIETLTEVLSFLDDTTLRSTAVPLVQRFCEQAMTAGDSSLPAVARLLGRFCHELKGAMSPEQSEWFLAFYCRLSQYSQDTGRAKTPSSLSLTPSPTTDNIEAECRRLCAYNFPAMLLFTGSAAFTGKLSTIFKKLVSDENPKIRRTVACGFHEVVRLLEDNCVVVATHYQCLLKDPSVEVLLGLVEHLPDVMESFAEASNLAPDTRQPGLLEFIHSLLSCEQTASKCRQWRLHEELLNHFSCLVHCMTSDQLHAKFVPITFRCLTRNYVLPVKLAAGRTLCQYVRHIRKAEQRQELCARIIEECAKSGNCRQRLLFVDICQFFLNTFSRSFFKENFFEVLLNLSHDPIVNVRLRLSRALPELKAILKLPGDRLLLQQLEQTVRRLISQERDRDASQAIRDAVLELDRIEVAMETLTRRTYFEADLIDQKREEEEKQLLLAEEREREKEGGNGGKQKDGGEGKKGSVAKQSHSPKVQLSKKTSVPGKAVKSPSVGRRGSGQSVGGGGGGSGPNSPSLTHRNTAMKSKGSITPNSIRRTLSPPSSSSSTPHLLTNHTTTTTGDGGAKRGQNSAGGSPMHIHVPMVTCSGSPIQAKHPVRLMKSLDMKKPPLVPHTSNSSPSSPSTPHVGKPPVIRSSSSPGAAHRLAVSRSKDDVRTSSPKCSNVVSSKKARQYGLTYANASTKGTARKT